MSTQATGDAKLIDKQDANGHALDYNSNVARDTLTVTSWTGESGTTWDIAKSPLGISPKCGLGPLELTDTSPVDVLATNIGYDYFQKSPMHENGYGSPKEKQRNGTKSIDFTLCQYKKSIHQALTNNFSSSSEALDPVLKEKCEREKIEGLSAEDFLKDCSKTVNSEFSKVIPLKPQRSKKSLNKDNKGGANPQNQSEWCIVGDTSMTQSKDESCETTRRGEENNGLQSPKGEVHEDSATTKYQSSPGPPNQQDFRQLRDATSPTLKGGEQQEYFKESPISRSTFPTVPPRTLPLKKQWSRDRHGNTDCTLIHFRTYQDTTKRKQAVKHPQPPVHHGKVKHCMSLIAMSCKSCFCHFKVNQKSHSYFRTHMAEKAKAIDRPKSSPRSSKLFAFFFLPPAKLDICLAISEHRGPWH
ncbi:uncharacterized protein LOC133654208 [Entelurus aequoreus]|uniref:uncharacterized protein LOC133654208 n=1 Tax=Entelurus aequoreus TaxID=161455 RepID=UPI002B1D3BFC|nr:uncharacterized protein LOC133654208 [Entelurus aequoreus]